MIQRCQVLFEKSRQIAPGEVVGTAELQPHVVRLGTLGVQLGLVAQGGDPSQGEAALGTDQREIDRVELLGLHERQGALRPGSKRGITCLLPQAKWP